MILVVYQRRKVTISGYYVTHAPLVVWQRRHGVNGSEAHQAAKKKRARLFRIQRHRPGTCVRVFRRWDYKNLRTGQ